MGLNHPFVRMQLQLPVREGVSALMPLVWSLAETL
jgi:hypothetical protein